MIFRFLSLTALSIMAAASAMSQSAPVRIMPLGDSITDGTASGTPGLGGYRGTLYNSLTTAGYNVDYVGTLSNNGSGLADPNHEGHSGWQIGQLDANIEAWFGVMADPDVILMHIGTNDFGDGVSDPTAIDRLDALILKIATLRPYAHIIVTNLMERAGAANTNIVAEFNPFVEARVNAHATAGRRVTFLDMRSAVPITDMPDNLHPNQTGYDKMAAAWLPAIQAVIGPDGDGAAPEIVRAAGVVDQTQVAVTFSKSVADSAANVANYALSGGLTVSAAAISADKRTVTLTTSAQTPGTTYTVTVNNVDDRLSPTPNTIAANSTANFLPVVLRGYLNNVPESAGYTLAVSLDVPNAVSWGSVGPSYAVDNREFIGAFNRVAYYVELQTASGGLQYLWASMDAFTTDLTKIAVPTYPSGAVFQQNVANMNVVSNSASIVNGTGLTGNLEFWPTNYSEPNAVGVPGASGSLYDFGDTKSAGTTGYGSMQLHHAAAGQTLFAMNNWGNNGTTNIDLGLGNDPAPINGGLDWTFDHNAANYTIKRIQVLVQTSGDMDAPTLAAAEASFGGSFITVTFSEPVLESTIKTANFTLDNGVKVHGAELKANQRDVVLTTTKHPAATSLTLSVSGVRDTSANANLIAPASTVIVGTATLPAEIVTNIGAAATGYELVYSADIPAAGNFIAGGADAYSLDDSNAFGTFKRVAYYMELQPIGGATQYVWVSMDAFSSGRKKIGVPTPASGAIFQQSVANMDVVSNVAGVVNGTGLAGGNIEFWPTSYSPPNAMSVPGASGTLYDFGDSRTPTGDYGSMQIHNSAATQTLMAMNNWGADGKPICIGIGNRPTNDPDWTFADNAASYSRRVLHVLILPGETTDAVVKANVPEAADYQLVYSLNIPQTGNLVGGANFQNYSVNKSSEVSGFTRVAYYMELQKTGDAAPRFVWVSMDAFTANANRIGVPTPASGAVFQQIVSNMNVVSNVSGVVNGTGISTGNIEFWPTDYSGPNAISIPNATGNFDFGDTRSTGGSHGSMQIHNHGASQTLFGLSGWGASGGSGALSMGIGNNSDPAKQDYTLTNNGASWNIKRLLHVYVLPGENDTSPPTLVRAIGSTSLDRLVLTLSEPVSDSSAVPANFSISGGVAVTGVTLLASKQEMILTTSAQTGATLYTVSVSGVCDRSTAGNVIAPGANTNFTAYSAPTVLANVPDAGYELINCLAIPTATPQWNLKPIPYGVDESKYGEQLFDRVAYLMELDSTWVYASFDPHTNSVSKVGVPNTAVTSTPFQQTVSNMNVASNVGSIVTGNGITTGNIEFWGGNYTGANGLNIPNASATNFDFGDTMTAGAHGSMQIHNYGASQTLMAYNNWGSNSGGTSDVGIGNNPAPVNNGIDWTFSNSASASTIKNLYVLVHPGGSPVGDAPTFYSHPLSKLVAPGVSFTLTAVAEGTGALSYQWRKGGVPIVGARNSWLELNNVSAADDGDYDVVATGANLVTATSLAGTVLVNAAPTFSGYGISANSNEATSVLVGKILANADDLDGDSLTISAVSAASAQGGTLSLGAGEIIYTSALNFSGNDSFTVTISDGRGGSVVGTINVVVSDGGDPSANQASLTVNGNGSVDVLFYGIPGRSYDIERSLDLVTWGFLQSVSAAVNGTVPFHDPAPGGAAFYRTRETP